MARLKAHFKGFPRRQKVFGIPAVALQPVEIELRFESASTEIYAEQFYNNNNKTQLVQTA
jgi:hypothetical protein